MFKHLKWAIALLIPLSLSMVLAHKSTHKAVPANNEFPEIIVKFKDQASADLVINKYSDLIVSREDAFELVDHDATDLDDYLLLDIQDKIDPHKLVNELKSMKGVEWVEQNQRVELPELIEIPFRDLEKKSGFNDPLADSQWSVDLFSIKAVHEKLSKLNIKPKKETVIAILDTGVDSKHEDLADKYKSSGTKTYDSDSKGHGTHCAGIAGAVSNNKKGVASLIPNDLNVKIMSIQVLNNFGFGTQQTIINGILKAADKGADVISLSLGGMSSEAKERAYEKAVKYANDKGAIVVVAAGNSSKNAKYFSPANTTGVIAVTAVDSTLNIAKFANTVDDLQMGIAAPGVNILSTYPKNQYKKFNGTSMAAPFVAGMVGVIKAYYPDLNTAEVYEKLIKSSFKVQASKTPLIKPDQIIDSFDPNSQ